MATSTLSSGRIARLKPISENFWRFKWSFASAKLAEKPPVGNSKGKQPARPDERFVEAFRSEDNPYPFMAVENSLNIRKGKIFELNNPVDLKKLKLEVKKAAKADTMDVANVFLSKLQVNWWALWTDNHFTEALRVARKWAREAIRDARAPYIKVYEVGNKLETYDRVMAALDAFEDLIAEIRMPLVKNYKQTNPYNGEGPSGYNL
ncbi:unnamed protein product [Penicillium egyptiacum]|uniref:Uncharacterized protein n=1 Tax=Penicillium egyptiacum TaxID=1303716 RepID=A0A9W4KGE6_9EURO|nr:unnamed protein product [Penicillium egyptiacum]